MCAYSLTLGNRTYSFSGLKDVLAKASPYRSGDVLAGLAAASAEERVAAKYVLSEVPLARFLEEPLVPYENDEVTRLIVDTHDAAAFRAVSSLSVGGFRDWLLPDEANTATLSALAPGLTPEMVAAVSKLMRNQDLVLVAKRCRVVTRFRTTIGLEGRFSTRLQPNHPSDDPRGILASIFDGLMFGIGDAVIGINPASDSVASTVGLLHLLDELRLALDAPVQSCVLTHVTDSLEAIECCAPLDLMFQSIAGTERANASFGVNRSLLREACDAARSLNRGTLGDNVMYFETGQGAALSAGAHGGLDMQTVEARAYAVARASSRFLSTPSSVLSGRSTSTTANRSLGRGSRITSAANSWACRWVATCAIPITPRPTRMIWTPS